MSRAKAPSPIQEAENMIPFMKSKGGSSNSKKKKKSHKVMPDPSDSVSDNAPSSAPSSSRSLLADDAVSSSGSLPDVGRLGPADPAANPLKNKPRARLVPDLSAEDVSRGFGYADDGKGEVDLERRREKFRAEAEETRREMERRPVDDRAAGGTADIMALFASKGKEEEVEVEVEGDKGMGEEEGGGGTPRQANNATEGGGESGDVKAASALPTALPTAAFAPPPPSLSSLPAAGVASSQTPKAELSPMWRNPATGETVPIDKRRDILKSSPAFKASWESVLLQCIRVVGKPELEKRLALLCALRLVPDHASSGGQLLCALAECGGVLQHAKEKLRLVGYRDEMLLAAEVTSAGQYVKVLQRHKEEPAGEKKAKGSGATVKKAGEVPEIPTQAIWKDPVTGQLMDAEMRKIYLLSSAAYRQCWEDVLGKLVKGVQKGEIEKGLAKICGALTTTNPKVTPEVAFCALAECLGIAQHAIAKLRHPGYVEEMRIADECCKVSQYVRVPTKRSPTKSKREGGGTRGLESETRRPEATAKSAPPAEAAAPARATLTTIVAAEAAAGAGAAGPARFRSEGGGERARARA